MREELLLVSKKLLTLKVHHFFLFAYLKFYPMATIIVFVLESLCLFYLKAVYFFLQVMKIHKNTFQVRSLLILLVGNCLFFLHLKSLVYFLEKRRCRTRDARSTLNFRNLFSLGLIITKSSHIMANLHRLNSLIRTTFLLSEVNPTNFLVRKHFPDNYDILNSNLTEDVHIISVVLVNDKSNVGARKLKIECFFLLFLKR